MLEPIYYTLLYILWRFRNMVSIISLKFFVWISNEQKAPYPLNIETTYKRSCPLQTAFIISGSFVQLSGHISKSIFFCNH